MTSRAATRTVTVSHDFHCACSRWRASDSRHALARSHWPPRPTGTCLNRNHGSPSQLDETLDRDTAQSGHSCPFYPKCALLGHEDLSEHQSRSAVALALAGTSADLPARHGGSGVTLILTLANVSSSNTRTINIYELESLYGIEP